MHYYKRNIGDYHRKAGRLSMLEHGAYTLLMDACYDREKFPTMDEAIAWSWARNDDEISAVKFVLSRFYVLTDGVYVQTHIAEDLETYRGNCSTNARIARNREEKKRERARSVVESFTNSEKNAPNHKPLTINQEPLTNNKTISAQVPVDGLKDPDSPVDEKPKKGKPDYPEWFNGLWLTYPPRSGSNDKRAAYKAACARVKEGYTHEQLEAATHRYRVWCLATGKLNTEYVKAAASFYGPGGHIDNPWEVTNGSNNQSPANSSSSGKRAFADIQRDQARLAIERIDRETDGNGIYTLK
jgi:uncharacterized protein YdaU (DUF1376 family)